MKKWIIVEKKSCRIVQQYSDEYTYDKMNGQIIVYKRETREKTKEIWQSRRYALYELKG